jgi:phage terminase large subunit-like protein
MRRLSMKSLRAAYLALPTRRMRDRFLKGLSDREAAAWLFAFEKEWARPEQLPPPGDWRTWLFMGGRGAGKTRAGAEWIRSRVMGADPPSRIALIGETYADVRDVMIDGVSGLLAVYPPGERPSWLPSRRRLEWRNGTIAQVFSADEPDGLRGPQFDLAWADEVAKWRYAERCWDNLQFALRLGVRPRQLVTTTPRPLPLLQQLLNAPDCVVTRAGTAANPYLPAAFLEAMQRKYGGTRLGRQELDGDIITERADALWTREIIEAARRQEAPHLKRIVIAIDPAATSRRNADATGIVAAGQGADGRGYVLDDATISNARPDQWAARAVALYHRHEADALVAEVNQGGDMVAAVIAAVDPQVVVTPVRATRGKVLRAEPIAALYAQGRISHVGCFPALEDELCDFGVDGLSGGRSPDRLDALVWALTALRLTTDAAPRLRSL